MELTETNAAWRCSIAIWPRKMAPIDNVFTGQLIIQESPIKGQKWCCQRIRDVNMTLQIWRPYRSLSLIKLQCLISKLTVPDFANRKYPEKLGEVRSYLTQV